jgi:hypothetical protein
MDNISIDMLFCQSWGLKSYSKKYKEKTCHKIYKLL